MKALPDVDKMDMSRVFLLRLIEELIHSLVAVRRFYRSGTVVLEHSPNSAELCE